MADGRHFGFYQNAVTAPWISIKLGILMQYDTRK